MLGLTVLVGCVVNCGLLGCSDLYYFASAASSIIDNMDSEADRRSVAGVRATAVRSVSMGMSSEFHAH